MTQLQLAQLIANLGQRSTYELAIAQAKQIELKRPRRVQAQTLIAHWQREIERLEDSPILDYARKLAEPGTIPNLRAAIAQANRIPLGRVMRGEAQGLAYDWRRRIEVLEDKPFLNLARLLASQGNLHEAIQTAAVIRPERALYWQAQAAIGDWQAKIQRVEIAQKAAAAAAIAARKPQPKESKETKLEFETPTPADTDTSLSTQETLEPEPDKAPPSNQATPRLPAQKLPPVKLPPIKLIPAEGPPVNRTAPPVYEVPHSPVETPAPIEVPAPIETTPHPTDGSHPVEAIPLSMNEVPPSRMTRLES